MDAASIAALARPVLAALFTLLATAGVLHSTNTAELDAAATLVGAAGAAAMALWGYLHSRNATKTAIAATRVAVADATNQPIAAIPDAAHADAMTRVKAYNATGGVPAPAK